MEKKNPFKEEEICGCLNPRYIEHCGELKCSNCGVILRPLLQSSKPNEFEFMTKVPYVKPENILQRALNNEARGYPFLFCNQNADFRKEKEKESDRNLVYATVSKIATHLNVHSDFREETFNFFWRFKIARGTIRGMTVENLISAIFNYINLQRGNEIDMKSVITDKNLHKINSEFCKVLNLKILQKPILTHVSRIAETMGKQEYIPIAKEILKSNPSLPSDVNKFKASAIFYIASRRIGDLSLRQDQIADLFEVSVVTLRKIMKCIK